ncbi:DUF11 domain-containing protein [Streptomyces sp. VRA16 Mangrove soil]|uniref:DUF11 domain-containing protein n=1 Tax=Streptomyces sp. VRA16 Mangrove soil TaxID=2817434 RepID=UPI001A9D2D6E|nr:DUF11 domain-containing protein [Streptomyces sp. VRA16 Mangrove soil]MBO1333720.1 DUF11 domain-containing protein [Streptomyces sp. VRA16 Mangrove soil]
MTLVSRVAHCALALPCAVLLLAPAAHGDGGGKGARGAGDGAVPPMSIEITDGVEAADSGDKLGYTIIVHNQGAEPIEKLRVEQRLPQGAGAPELSEGGKARTSGLAVWTADVKANHKTTFTSRVRLGKTGKDTLRVASTVCAYVDGAKAPAVCASDLDTLPAGAAGAAGERAADASGGSGTAALVGGGAALAAAGGALVVIRRRRARAHLS